MAAAADGMAAAMCEEPVGDGDRRSIEVSAESREALLFDYLDQLIYERDVRSVLPVDNDATVSAEDGTPRLEASYRGLPLAGLDARDLKAVTYSERGGGRTWSSTSEAVGRSPSDPPVQRAFQWRPATTG